MGCPHAATRLREAVSHHRHFIGDDAKSAGGGYITSKYFFYGKFVVYEKNTTGCIYK